MDSQEYSPGVLPTLVSGASDHSAPNFIAPNDDVHRIVHPTTISSPLEIIEAATQLQSLFSKSLPFLASGEDNVSDNIATTHIDAESENDENSLGARDMI